MTLSHELASEHQLEVCYVPHISSQNPFLEQLEATVRNVVQEQLAEHREQEEKCSTFLAKAPLLRLAGDILTCTLAAVLPPPTANNSMDIWSRSLAQDKQLAGHVNKMCQRNKCPVSEQQLAIEFNQIRHDRQGRFFSFVTFFWFFGIFVCYVATQQSINMFMHIQWLCMPAHGTL